MKLGASNHAINAHGICAVLCGEMLRRSARVDVAPELLEAMRQIKMTDGVPMSVQVDFALRAWLQARGIELGAEPKRRAVSKRKRVAW